MSNKITSYAKAWTAVAGGIAQLIAYGIVPDRYENLVSGVVAAVTAFFVWYVPNKPYINTTATEASGTTVP